MTTPDNRERTPKMKEYVERYNNAIQRVADIELATEDSNALAVYKIELGVRINQRQTRRVGRLVECIEARTDLALRRLVGLWPHDMETPMRTWPGGAITTHGRDQYGRFWGNCYNSVGELTDNITCEHTYMDLYRSMSEVITSRDEEAPF